MIKHGVAPYLECSSRGDRRFSAFYARPKSLKGKSIEEAYQSLKLLADGTNNDPHNWRSAKGKRALNQLHCQENYIKWWKEYIKENNLLEVLREATGLSDIFGQIGHICQATVLWDIRNSPDSE